MTERNFHVEDTATLVAFGTLWRQQVKANEFRSSVPPELRKDLVDEDMADPAVRAAVLKAGRKLIDSNGHALFRLGHRDDVVVSTCLSYKFGEGFHLSFVVLNEKIKQMERAPDDLSDELVKALLGKRCVEGAGTGVISPSVRHYTAPDPVLN